MSSLQVITAPAKEWLAALTRLTPALVGKKAVPILNSVRINPAEGVLSGFNYETSAVTKIDAEGEGSPFLANWRWLLDSIKLTTSQSKTAMVSVTATDERVTVAACGYELHAELLKLADYPEIPFISSDATTRVPASEFRASLSRVVSVASTEDRMPTLATVQLKMDGGDLRMIATDRFRLAMDRVHGDGRGSAEFLLRARTAKAWDKYLVGEDIEVAISEDALIVKTELVTFTSQGIDGDYPKIANLFYTDASGAFEIDRAVMLASAKVAAAMTERNTPCFIRVFDGGAEVTFNDHLFGLSKAPIAPASAVAGCKDEISFAMAPRFFVDALQRIPTKSVRISYQSSNKPFAITAEGVAAGDTEALNFLVMPVRMPRG